MSNTTISEEHPYLSLKYVWAYNRRTNNLELISDLDIFNDHFNTLQYSIRDSILAAGNTMVSVKTPKSEYTKTYIVTSFYKDLYPEPPFLLKVLYGVI